MMLRHQPAPMCKRLTLPLLVAACLIVLTTPRLLNAQSAMQEDLRHRDPAVRWPPGYDPASAKLFSHNELLIPVSCERAFRRLTDAESWPTWLVFAKDVQTVDHAPLGKGSTFSWRIFGNMIQSRVEEYEPNRQIGWLHLASRYYQAWLLQPENNGCHITTEEIGIGDPAAHAAAIGDVRTHRAHDLWLASLQWIAEGGTNLR